MDLNIYRRLDEITRKLSGIETNIQRLDEKMDFAISLTRNQLLRVKNNQYLDDSAVLLGLPYNDISPQKAHEIIENDEVDFMILDVSNEGFTTRLPNSKKIPLEQLNSRYSEITDLKIPLMVISERGLRSIKACEILVRKGFFNCNNVSGGYECWPKNHAASPPLAA